MDMLTAPQTVEIGQNLGRNVREFRAQLWRRKVGEAILAAVCGLFVAYLALFALDRFVDAPVAVRAAIFVAGLLGFAVFLPLAIRRWIWGTRRVDQVARVVMSKLPAAGEQILSAVELARTRSSHHSPQLVDAAIDQVDRWIVGQDLSRANPTFRLRAWGTAATVVVFASVLIYALAPSAAANCWQRFWRPFGTTPRYTFARLEPLPAEVVAPFAEPFTIRASLARDADWRPGTATASLPSTNRRVQLDANGQYVFDLPGQTSPTVVTVRAGDATAQVRVLPTTRPELVRIAADIKLPDYLQRTEPAHVESSRGSIAALVGSTVDVVLAANRDLQTAESTGAEVTLDGSHARFASTTIQDDVHATITWRDRHGLEPAEPVELRIRATSDDAPVLECSGLASESAVLESEVLELNVSASDDYGLRRVGLEWQGEPDPLSNQTPAAGEQSVVIGGPLAVELSGQATFSAAVAKVPPQVIRLRAFAEDYLPDRERTYSPTYVVRILSPEDHAAWVADQLRRWQSQADAVYEEELRLLEQNRGLRQLAEESPPTGALQRMLQQHEAEERANAKALDSATATGRELLDKAVKNETIRADQLNRWAKGLQRLEDIANNRMPSIADELNRMADSVSPESNAGGRPAGETQSEQPVGPEVAGVDRRPENGAGGVAANDDSPENDGAEDSQEPLPGVVDRESSLVDGAGSGAESGAGNAGGGQGGASGLGTPDTTLGSTETTGGGGHDRGGHDDEQDPAEHVDRLVENHTRLLDEFRKARDELNELLQDFEGSTFVKRLKAASRNQLQLAQRINGIVAKDFGAESATVDDGTVGEIVTAQKEQSRFVNALREDLAALDSRRPGEEVQAVLDEMRELNMQVKLDEMPLRLERNLNGDALNRAEFWADTFDRWAEELVGPSSGDDGGGQQGNDEPPNNLPPPLLVEIMRIIHGEINLREQTRAIAQLDGAADRVEFEERATGAAVQQMSLQERTLNAIEDIDALPQGRSRFSREVDKLQDAVVEMESASELLVDLQTGPPTIAAETAAIEALLAARRQSGRPSRGSGSGGGGGSLTGGRTNRAPLDLVGPDRDSGAVDQPRDVGAAAGAVGVPLPEEYRQGLDDFQNGMHRLKRGR